MAFGPETGLLLLAEIEAEPQLAGYAALYAAKGDFLMRLGRILERARSCSSAAERERKPAPRRRRWQGRCPPRQRAEES
ncbi:MAG: hypothetical protein U5N27_20940 [Rhizobium sp.]|nr:hypothetical protein [Rhizobium sp.]